LKIDTKDTRLAASKQTRSIKKTRDAIGV